MDFDEQLDLEHILFFDRKCRNCGKIKSLLDDFYLIRKNKGAFPSAYSYECKDCTKERTIKTRKINNQNKKFYLTWEYPDW
jgi:hypothetical protein